MEAVNILTQIEEGMEVFDDAGEQVGKVRQVRMTDEQPGQPGAETESTTTSESVRDPSFIEDIARAFVDEPQLPEDIRHRLLHEGFIRIDVGLLHSDRFVMPEQIRSVSANEVHLNVGADELTKNR